MLEMLEAGGVGAEIMIGRIQLLDGAETTIGMGILSSLHPQNMAAAAAIGNLDSAAGEPVFPVLFDPQTAGGLLVAIPSDRSEACVEELRRAGYLHAAIIARVTGRSKGGPSVTIRLDNAADMQAAGHHEADADRPKATAE